MLILGIESSCDETAIALVRNGREVLASTIASQTSVHAQWGGVVPEIAAREHLSALQQMYREAMQQAGVSLNDIDAIAVTQGPGLIGCLLVGASFAKGLAQSLGRPLIPVNHVHAHVHGALLGVSQSIEQIFPTIAAVVSGGHTNIYFMQHPTHFELLAHTMDDACGESFDKVGKMLGLPYPGGPHVEALAKQGTTSKVSMPTMVERKSQMAFSYSGLKTAVAHALRNLPADLSTADVAAAFQEEALHQLARKLASALKMKPETKTILISGGVAANQRFKEILAASVPLPCLFPQLKYCSDNGAMIAAMAYYQQTSTQTPKASEWDVFSRYPFEQFMQSTPP